MTPEFLNLYRKLRQCYGDLLLQMNEIQGMLDESLDLNEQADRVYALRECEKVAEDLYKEFCKLHNVQQKLACIVEMTGIQDGASTEYCTGNANEQKIVDIPQKRRYNPEAFDKLMEFLMVPAPTYMAELVRPHWPNCQEYFNELLAKGRSLPIEVSDTFIYKFSIRKRKGLDVD